MNLNSDISKIFNTNHFAETAVYTPQGGSAKDAKGIFSAESTGVELGHVEVVGNEPFFVCAESEAPNAKKDDSLVLASVSYLLKTPTPMGNGFLLMKLRKV